MRFTTLLLLTPLAAALVAEPATPYALAGFSEVEAREAAPGDLVARACKDTGCKCSTKHKLAQGQYCSNCVWSNGDGYIITAKRVDHHVYECSPSGDCCDYGYASDCGSGTARCG